MIGRRSRASLVRTAANQLRRLNPDIEIVWLAGDPARRLLEDAGEILLPQSAAFAEETGTAEAAGEGSSLNVVNFAPEPLEH